MAADEALAQSIDGNDVMPTPEEKWLPLRSKILKALSNLPDVLVERFPEEFGGLVNAGSGRYVIHEVASASTGSQLRTFVDSYLQSSVVVAEDLPQISYESAENSLVQLREVEDRIVADIDELRYRGVQITAVGIDSGLNRVVVGTLPINASQRAAVLAQYGEPLISLQTSSGFVQSADRFSDDPPF